MIRKTGTLSDNFNFVGYLPRLIEIINSSERKRAMMPIEHFSSFVGEEYKINRVIFYKAEIISQSLDNHMLLVEETKMVLET